MTSNTWRSAAGVLALALAAACTTTGVGTGTTRGDETPVSFNWTSDNSVSGTMSATLANGQSFTGKFFQVTSDTRVDNLRPLWVGWGRHRNWPYWGLDAGPDFVKHYSGKVLANLEGPSGQHMRCSFHLIQPASGMGGGGAGQCQTPSGQAVDATFPAA